MPDQYQQQMMPYWNTGFQNPYGPQNQDGMLLNQLSQGYAPIMTMPQQQMRTGFEQLPGFSSPGLTGMAMNAFVAPMLQQQMQKRGMVPGGMSSQNIMDYMKKQQYQTQQHEMMSRIAQDTTTEGVVSFARGAAEMSGREFDAPQRAAARRMGQMAATAAPFLAQMMPDQLDALSGRKGSAVVMAQRMMDTNRFRTDPVTGLMGMTAESTEQQARELFGDMFADENMSQMRGVKAGEVGSLYKELTRRGMVGGDSRPMHIRRAEATANVMATGGAEARQRVMDALGDDAPLTAEGEIDYRNLTPEQSDKLGDQADVQTQMRSFNSDKVKSSLEGYVDVVSTMKEIFGEMGQSDAPMAKLIQGLEGLSQGALTQVSPTKLNDMVRTTTELAQTSGVSLDQAVMMQQQAAGQLQNRGMNRVFSSQVTQGSLGYGQAAANRGDFASPTWGQASLDEARQLDQTLRVQATDSPMANAWAALVRAGGDLEGGYTEGSAAQRIRTAIRNKQSTYIDPSTGETKNIGDIRPGEFTNIMAEGSGGVMTQQNAQQYIMQRAANDETKFENDIGNNIRENVQSKQIAERLFAGTGRRRARGMEGVEEGQEEAVGEALSQAMQNMTDEERADKSKRNEILAEAIQSAAPGVSDSQAKMEAGLYYGSLEEQVTGAAQGRGDKRLAGYGSLETLLDLQDSETLKAGGRNRRMAEVDAGIKNDLAGLTGGSWLGNMVSAVQEAGEGEEGADLTEVLSKTVGGVRAEEIQDRMEPALLELKESRNKIENLREKYANAPDDATRNQALRDIEEERILMKNKATEIRDMAETSGILEQEGALDLTDVQQQREAAQVVRSNRADVTRHMFGEKQDTDEELRRGSESGLLDHNIGEMAGDDAVVEQIVADRVAAAAEDEDAEEIDETKLRTDIRKGDVDLTPEERLTLLKSRQDRIDTRPTEAELEEKMEQLGISKEDQKKRSVRAAIQESLSVQKRMVKTGTTKKDLSHIKVTADDRNRAMAKADIDTSGMTWQQKQEAGEMMDTTIRMNKGSEAIGLSALSEDDNAEELDARWQTLQDTGVASSIRKGEKELRDRNAELLESAVLDPNFLKKTGGRGLQAIREMESARQDQTRLSQYYGGDAARQSIGIVDRTGAANRERLSDLVEADQLDLFSKRGELDPRFAELEGFKGKRREDFMADTAEGRELRVNLGAVHVEQQNRDARKRQEDATFFIEEAIGREGLTANITPSGEVIDAIAGKGGELAESEMGEAKRLQAFRNIQLGMEGDAVEGMGMEDLKSLASESKGWGELSEEGRDKEVKRWAEKTGMSEDQVKKMVRLGEATETVGGADDEASKTMTRIRDGEKKMERVARRLGMGSDEDQAQFSKDMEDMGEGEEGAQEYVDAKLGSVSAEDARAYKSALADKYGGRGLSEDQKAANKEAMVKMKAEAESRGISVEEFQKQIKSGVLTEGSEQRDKLVTDVQTAKKTADGVEAEKRTLETQMGKKEGSADEIIAAQKEREEFNKKIGEEAREIAGLDKGGTIGKMGEALGLAGDSKELKDLRRGSGAFGASDEGKGWTNLITRSATQANEIADKVGMDRKDLFKMVQSAEDEGETADELRDRINEGRDPKDQISAGEARALQRSGRNLEGAGMLGALAEGKEGEELQQHITSQLESLEKSGISAEESKEQIIEMRGKVKIEGNMLDLSQTQGTTGR